MESNQKIKPIPPLIIGETTSENKIIKFFKVFQPIINFYNGKISGGGLKLTFKIGKEK